MPLIIDVHMYKIAIHTILFAEIKPIYAYDYFYILHCYL